MMLDKPKNLKICGSGDIYSGVDRLAVNDYLPERRRLTARGVRFGGHGSPH